MKNIKIVIAGPSGSGKDAICKSIKKIRKDIFLNVSYTTREIRKEDNELDGVDYNFVSKNEFISMIKNNEFIEFEEFDGFYYGTRKISKELLEKNDILFRKDVRGAISIKEKYPFVITFYIMPKDEETLKNRRKNRGENREEISKGEVDLAKKLDFLIINDDKDKAVNEILTIIDIYKTCSMTNPENIKFLDEFYK